MSNHTERKWQNAEKSLKRLTAMDVIVSMFLMTVAEAFAKETGADDTSGIYIATLPVPEEAISYAQTSVGGMIQDLYDMEWDIIPTVGTISILYGIHGEQVLNAYTPVLIYTQHHVVININIIKLFIIGGES